MTIKLRLEFKHRFQLCFFFVKQNTLIKPSECLFRSCQLYYDSNFVCFLRKRRESSADSGIRSMGSKSRRESHHNAISDFKTEVAKLWQRRESVTTTIVSPSSVSTRRDSGESIKSGRRDSITYSQHASRRGSGESAKSSK